MTREEYIKAVNSILHHDAVIARVRDVSRDLAREVGDDFGGLALVPQTGMRETFIKVIEGACGDESSNTTYLFEEAVNMPDGGRIHMPGGKIYPITNAEDCWDAIQAFKAAP